MRKTKIALAFSLAVFFAGCTATGDDYVKGFVPEVTNHPVLGALNSKGRALLGPDANDNGVRDDIDRIALIQHADAYVLALRFASKFTIVMLNTGAGVESRGALDASELVAAASALDAAAGPQSSNTLAARIANTPERRAAASAAGISLAR